MKNNLDSDMIEKYIPNTLSIEQFIYANLKYKADMKMLTEEYTKMTDLFNNYKQRVEED